MPDPYGVSGPIKTPYLRLFRTTTQTISDSTDTPVEFDEVHPKSDKRFLKQDGAAVGHWRSAYAPVSGLYMVNATAGFTANNSGNRSFGIFLNGSIEVSRRVLNTADATFAAQENPTSITYMNKGEFIQFIVEQQSSGDLDLLTDDKFRPFLEVCYLGFA